MPVPLTSETVFQATWLVLKYGTLAHTSRPVGMNDIVMLAWHCTLRPPQYPNGREIVLTATDVTLQSGSFLCKGGGLLCCSIHARSFDRHPTRVLFMQKRCSHWSC